MADQKPASAQDVIDTLKSIDTGIKALLAHFGALRVPVNGNVPASRPSYDVPQVASDRDLDSKWGDPFVRAKSPRDWTGENQLGKPFSECPPEYLEMVADRLDYFCETEEDAKKLKYQRLDASRARGWAKRLRGGWTPPETQTATGFPSDAPVDDDIPF